MLERANRILNDVFGYEELRPYQEDSLISFSKNSDTFIVMPTGSGKSLCYQMPALLSKGVTLVISPLISLMKDQVEQLQHKGIRATFINSTIPPDEIEKRFYKMQNVFYDLIYIAPERLGSYIFRSTFDFLRNRDQIDLIVIDEAHCISQWGHDFRPAYQKIRFLRKNNQIPFMALTATATPKVQKDIIKQLNLHKPTFISGSFDRPNLRYFCIQTKRKDSELLRYLSDKKDVSGIIYAGTRGKVDELVEYLDSKGFKVRGYHAGMEDQERHKVQDLFLKESIPLVVATNAFGMGINKPNVRFVIHYNMPGSLESYTQEAGRSGRDGENADCILLYGREDRGLQEFFINGNNPPYSLISSAYKIIVNGNIGEDRLLEVCKFHSAANPMSIRALIGILQEHHYIEFNGGVVHAIDKNKSLDDLPKEHLEQKRQIAFEKLDYMEAYCKKKECLRNFIQSYFGFSKVSCNNCSVCLEGASKDEIENINQSSDLERVKYSILGCIRELTSNFGIHMIADIVIGTKSNRIIERGLDKLSFFGYVSTYTKDDVVTVIWDLVNNGYLDRSTDEYPVLSLNPEGFMEFFKYRDQYGKKRDESKVKTRSKKKKTSHGTHKSELKLNKKVYNALKAYCRMKGEELNVYVHNIINERTLRDIATFLPGTLDELLEIYGVGRYTLERFGKDILKVVRLNIDRPGTTEQDRPD